ncbi:MAG TPA: hypothetical protein VLA49_13700 [Anaerolineales bacterium]|nr:hypothetical protein [Anaerolineales bacterium]
MMTKKVFSLITILFAILVVMGRLGSPQAKTNLEPDHLQTQDQSAFLSPNMGCTVIYAADEQVALGGNNEDYSNPSTMAWFLPPEEGKYGRVYFGYEGFLWGGGMNDQGLFFDAMAVDEGIQVARVGKPMYDGKLEDKIMAECADVDCVIDLYSQYHSFDTWYHQFLFGDSYGNSVIVEPLTFLRNQKNYQVATNFYQSRGFRQDSNQGNRYHTATNLFETADTFSVELIRDILDAVHFEEDNPTLYSQVYDLKTRTVYLYFFHDFEDPIVFQLDEELVKGKHSVILSDLFPENQAFQDWAKPTLHWLDKVRAAYPEFDEATRKYEAFRGKYALPAKMGLPYPYYEIAEEDGTLLLKIYPDKGWLDLIPFAENSFYHVSSFSQFEITFLPDENGQVNQFLYVESGVEYTFNRLEGENPIQGTAVETAIATPTATATSPSPTETATVAPTWTAEPPRPSLTPTNTQPTPSPLSQSLGRIPTWLIFPVVGIVFLIFLYFVRQNKQHSR